MAASPRKEERKILPLCSVTVIDRENIKFILIARQPIRHLLYRFGQTLRRSRELRLRGDRLSSLEDRRQKR